MQPIQSCVLHCSFVSDYFIVIKILFFVIKTLVRKNFFNKNKIYNWRVKPVVRLIMKRISKIFTIIIENVKFVIAKGAENVIMR